MIRAEEWGGRGVGGCRIYGSSIEGADFATSACGVKSKTFRGLGAHGCAVFWCLKVQALGLTTASE